MPICMILVELAITRVHDYMVVTIKVNKICGKMNLNKWTLTIAASPGRVAQSVTCLTAFPGVASSIPVRSHTFVEIDHEMISTVILLLPLIHSRRVVVSYKRKYVHELLVNRLFKPAQEKVW